MEAAKAQGKGKGRVAEAEEEEDHDDAEDTEEEVQSAREIRRSSVPTAIRNPPGVRPQRRSKQRPLDDQDKNHLQIPRPSNEGDSSSDEGIFHMSA